jgi:hypothetical protein
VVRGSKSLCVLCVLLRLKQFQYFVWEKKTLALTGVLSPQERSLPMARCYYSTACRADPDAGVSKAGGNSDRGIRDRGIKFTYPHSFVSSGRLGGDEIVRVKNEWVSSGGSLLNGAIRPPGREAATGADLHQAAAAITTTGPQPHPNGGVVNVSALP